MLLQSVQKRNQVVRNEQKLCLQKTKSHIMRYIQRDIQELFNKLLGGNVFGLTAPNRR